MTYKCDIKFMAVPSRMQNVTTLCMRLGLSISDVAIDTDLSFLPLKTSQKAFSLPKDKGVTHRLVLQDDVLVNPYLKESIIEVINRFPNNPIALFMGTEKNILENGFYRLHFLTAQGIIMPFHLIDDLKVAYSQFRDFPHDDWFYSWYCKNNNIAIIGVKPNLVTINANIESTLDHINPTFKETHFTMGKVDVSALPDRTYEWGDNYHSFTMNEMGKKKEQWNKTMARLKKKARKEITSSKQF